MDRYSMRNLEDLVVPNYHETSDSYPSPDVWGGWNMNSSEADEKCFDYDVINNGFTGGLYSQMEMEMGTSQQVKEESTKSKSNGYFYHSLHDFDGIQQMDDIFLNSILEDVPGNLHSSKESDTNSPSSSMPYLDNLDAREVKMFHYDWETCQDMPIMEEDAAMNLCEETSAEEVVLQDLQRATEKLTDDTRKCFRDTFYRLAKNSQQKSDLEEFLDDETRKKQETELETNSIDRAVANLTFNKMESNMRNLSQPKRVSSIQ